MGNDGGGGRRREDGVMMKVEKALNWSLVMSEFYMIYDAAQTEHTQHPKHTHKPILSPYIHCVGIEGAERAGHADGQPSLLTVPAGREHVLRMF